jgi:hypothetical protein
MNPQERAQLITRLRSLVAAPPGLQFDSVHYWEVSGVNKPELFFENLSLLMPTNSVLYLEGVTTHLEAATLYSKHRASNTMPIDCGTIFPVPDMDHLNFDRDLVNGILEILERRTIQDLLTHLSGYVDRHLIFSFHDAFEGDLHVSDGIPEDSLRTFCGALGASYFRKENTARSRPYEDLLRLFEKPERLKIKRRFGDWFRDMVQAFREGYRDG